MSVKLNLLAPSTGASNQKVDYTVVNNASSNATLADDKKATYVENTLAGELNRIKAYIAEIGREAAFLALQAAGANVDQNSKLDQIAEAMLSIVKNSAADAIGGNQSTGEGGAKLEEIVIDAGKQTVLPKGYYVDGVTVRATSLADQSTGTATAKDIFDGATAWVNGVKITGTSTSDLTKKGLTDTKVYKETADKLQINVNGTDDEANDKWISTDIKYVNGNELVSKVVIKKVTTPDGDESSVADAVQLPAGFYPSNFSIPVYVEDAKGTEEKVLNVTHLNVTGDVDFGAEAKKVYEPDSTKYDYYTGVTIDKASFKKNTVTGGYSVEKAGWVNSTESLVGLAEGSYEASGTIDTKNDTVTIVKVDHGYTPDSVVATLPVTANPEAQEAVKIVLDNSTGKASFSTNVEIAPGYHKAGTVAVSGTVDLTSIAGSHTFTQDEPKEAEKANYTVALNKQYFTDDIKKGYIAASDTKKYKVRDAIVAAPLTATKADGANKAKINVVTTTTGWFEGAQIEYSEKEIKSLVNDLTTVETVSYTSTNTAKSSAIANTAGAVVTAKEGSFYDSVNMSSLLTDLKGI